MLLAETLHDALPLSEYHRTRINLIDQNDYTGVLRKVREETAKYNVAHPDVWYTEGLLALKQYYAVALLDGMNMHAVSDRVDPFWHAHILHTKQYTQFCDDVVGGYMHHEPLDPEDIIAVNHVATLYNFTRKRYDEIFKYTNDQFNPRTLSTDELICVHFGASYSAADKAIFLPHPDAQPLTTFQ